MKHEMSQFTIIFNGSIREEFTLRALSARMTSSKPIDSILVRAWALGQASLHALVANRDVTSLLFSSTRFSK